VSLIGASLPLAMVDDVSAKVLSDLGLHGYEHYGPDRVDAVADGLFVRTGFWTVPDLASEITRAAAVTTIRGPQRPSSRESREATAGQSSVVGKGSRAFLAE
jgi:hypothetical protein